MNALWVCEGVEVQPGDLIVAGGDAVTCVLRDDGARVITAAHAKMPKEDETANKVLAGGSV